MGTVQLLVAPTEKLRAVHTEMVSAMASGEAMAITDAQMTQWGQAKTEYETVRKHAQNLMVKPKAKAKAKSAPAAAPGVPAELAAPAAAGA